MNDFIYIKTDESGCSITFKEEGKFQVRVKDDDLEGAILKLLHITIVLWEKFVLTGKHGLALKEAVRSAYPHSTFLHEKKVQMTKRLFFTVADCPICKKAKEIGIPEDFKVFDTTKYSIDMMAETAFYDIFSFPAIIIDDNDTITRYSGEEVLAYLRREK